MDDARMARRFTSIVLLIMLLAPYAAPALAQSGACPDFTSTLSPTPSGTYPGPTSTCAYPSSPSTSTVSVVYDGMLPCGSGVLFDTPWTMASPYEALIFVPPADQTFPSGYAAVKFAVTVDYDYLGSVGIIPNVRVRTYDTSHNLIGSFTIGPYPYSISQVAWDTMIFYYSAGGGYPLTGGPPDLPMVQGGYISVELPDGIVADRMFVSGFMITDNDALLSPPCGNPPPPTPQPTYTPTPSQTPTGTVAPTPTPTNTITPTLTHTPFPTAIGGTITPLPSATPFIVSTAPSPPTATPWAMPTFPSFLPPPITPPDIPALPTLSNPSLPPIVGTPDWPIVPTPITGTFSVTGTVTMTGTRAAQLSQIRGVVTSTGILVTRWYTQTNEAIGWLDPDANTSGISTTQEIATGIATYVTTPISYIRAIKIYLPTLWPYILIVFLLLLWVFLNLLVKYGLGVFAEMVEALRKLIELIPGF